MTKRPVPNGRRRRAPDQARSRAPAFRTQPSSSFLKGGGAGRNMMRKVVFLGAIFVCCGCGPRWEYEFGFAQQRARTERKVLVVYFTDLLANEHYDIERELLNHSSVRPELRDTVNVMLSFHWGPAPKSFRIREPYVCIVCDPGGNELERMDINPMPPPERFAEWLRTLKQRVASAGPQSQPAAADTTDVP